MAELAIETVGKTMEAINPNMNIVESSFFLSSMLFIFALGSLSN